MSDVTSFSMPEMLTRACSLNKYTLFLLPFDRVNVIEMGLKGIEMSYCTVRFSAYYVTLFECVTQTVYKFFFLQYYSHSYITVT